MRLLKYFYIITCIFLISGCATNQNSSVSTSFTPQYPQSNNPGEPANRMVNVMTHY